MKIIYSDLKKGKVKVCIENLDDLWYLSQIIELGDFVKGQTIRKIKLGSEERNIKIIKKKVFIKIKVEKVEFHKYSNALRVSGKIEQAPEDIPKGSYHTITLEVNSTIEIIKEKFLKYQIDRLKEAGVESSRILICVLDREEAYFALLKRYGYEVLSELKGEVSKKQEPKAKVENFYGEIIKVMKEYVDRFKIESIVVASPAFWKEDLMEQVKEKELKEKIVLATCSSADQSGISEILKRPEVKNLLKQERTAKEINLVEELLEEISKQGPATYGLKEVEQAAEIGAVKTLLVTDSLIIKKRNEGYEELDKVMKNVDKSKGEIFIISSEHDGGRRLEGLGGIGAILRYKLSY